MTTRREAWLALVAGLLLVIPLAVPLAVPLAIMGAATAAAQTTCDGPVPLPPTAEALKAGATVRIADWAWSDGVSQRCPGHRLGTQLEGPEAVWLWMRLEGGAQALEKLRKEGRLPIRHIWSRAIGTSFIDLTKTMRSEEFNDLSQVIDDIPVGQSVNEKLADLSREHAARAFFDWRTWSRKSNISSGFWRVTVLDQLNQPVPCAENLKCQPCAGGVPCAFMLKVE